ncbi:MAG: hypothetical protein VX899_10070 [Myxococcota bacterium]|nr:hypothetical protein [Myxococcota bacterium]
MPEGSRYVPPHRRGQQNNQNQPTAQPAQQDHLGQDHLQQTPQQQAQAWLQANGAGLTPDAGTLAPQGGRVTFGCTYRGRHVRWNIHRGGAPGSLWVSGVDGFATEADAVLSPEALQASIDRTAELVQANPRRSDQDWRR